jgi:aminopeptidase N
MIRWKGLHPTPYDLFATFDQIAGEDLGWFWTPWFFSYGYADLALGKITQSGGLQQVEIMNPGEYPVPVKLTVHYADGRVVPVEKKMDWWKNGEGSRLLEIPAGKVSGITLNPARVPDANPGNNNFKAK